MCAFQSTASRHLWSEEEVGVCFACGAPEDKWHRFVTCPCFGEVRARHPEALFSLQHEHPHWVHCPFATRHEVVDILTLLFATRPPPAQPTREAAELQAAGREAITFYTDGTSSFPKDSMARQAAWAVVSDDAGSELARSVAIHAWTATGQIPAAFCVRSQGVVPGRQTVARAELCAALQAIRLAKLACCSRCVVVTDSSYVVGVLQGLAQDARALAQSANVDLLLLLQQAWFSGVSVAKVKSHVSDGKARALRAEELWNVLENRAADQACKAARALDLPVVEEMTSHAAAYNEAQLVSLKRVYRYLLDLNAAQHAWNPRQNSSGISPQPTSMDGPISHPPPAIMIFRDSHGAWLLQEWSGIGANSWYGTGTTAVELLCHFVYTTGQLPPLRVQHETGRTTLVPWNSPVAAMLPGNLRYWTHALTRATQYLEKATGWTLLAGRRHNKVGALGLLGARHPRAGTTYRVTLPFAAALAPLVMQVATSCSASPLVACAKAHGTPWDMGSLD